MKKKTKNKIGIIITYMFSIVLLIIWPKVYSYITAAFLFIALTFHIFVNDKDEEKPKDGN